MKMKTYGLTLMVIIFSLAMIGNLHAQTTHNVSPGDNIQAAIDYAAVPGDIIVFALGTYDLPATLNVHKSLTLTSTDPLAEIKPIIDGGGTLGKIIYIDADDVIIDGLEIANGTGDLIRQSYAYFGTTIRNCVIHDSSGDEGIQLKNCTDCLVECNVVYDVAQDGISIADGSYNSVIRNNEIYNVGSENAAIYVYDSYDMTVECNYIHDTQAANGVGFYYNYGGTHTIANNLIVHNRWWGGKHCYNEADGSAIWIYKPRVSSIYVVSHNTLDDNTPPVNSCAQPGNAIYVRKSADGVVVDVVDNIVTNHNGYGIRTWSGAAVNYSYNDLWQNTLGATDGNPVNGGGNISANPQYNPDYTLQAGSPCIGTASGNEDMGVLFDECGCAPPVIEVDIDIKPGSDQNTITLSSAGLISVAILSSDTFDATTVDPGTVTLAGAGIKMAGKSDKYLSHERDVNNDGLLDLVCQILTAQFMIEPGATNAMLTAETFEGQSISGNDIIRIVPDN